MTDFEERAHVAATYQLFCWFRKVDNTFVMLNNGQDSYALLQHLNSQHPRIEFAMEKENGEKIPFLDVLVIRDDNAIKTIVYRIPHILINTSITGPIIRLKL